MATEKRLIDANALKAYINSKSTHSLNEWDTIGVLAAIDKQPSVDAVEVVHGRWEYDFEPIAWCEDYVKEVYTCSVCECRSQDESHYCPNCGADMRERKDDG